MTKRRQVLVVDDEVQIRRVLRAYLEADGFAVEEAGSGAETLELSAACDPALILLDVGLPDMDGMEVLRRLRTHSEVYVILVTARSEELDKLVGLTMGADDYITKPFSPREVVARVNTVLRRSRSVVAVPGGPVEMDAGSTGMDAGLGGGVDAVHGPGPGRTPSARPGRAVSVGDDEVRRFPGLVVDARRREIHVEDREVTLSMLEFDLLWALAGDCGRVFSRAQLLERVWGYDFYGDERVVDVHVRNIRRALRDDAAHPRIIGTVRGVGYKFLLRPGPDGRDGVGDQVRAAAPAGRPAAASAGPVSAQSPAAAGARPGR